MITNFSFIIVNFESHKSFGLLLFCVEKLVFWIIYFIELNIFNLLTQPFKRWSNYFFHLLNLNIFSYEFQIIFDLIILF